MSDIFISYAKEDRERAAVLAAALGGLGWSVFWDRTIPGGLTWREFIGKELEEARSVLVAWSEASIKSQWVLEEAEQAKKKRILIPVFIQPVETPLGFGALQADDLSSWDGSVDAPAFQKLAEDLERLLGTAPNRAEQEERPRAERAGREKQTSAVPVAEGSGDEAGREAQLVSSGGEESPVGRVAVDQQEGAAVETEGGQVMTYLKEKLLPGVIAALIVAVLLGIVSALSSGRLIGLAGGARSEDVRDMGGATPEDVGDMGYATLEDVRDMGYATLEDVRGMGYATLDEVRSSMDGELTPTHLALPTGGAFTEATDLEPESYAVASSAVREDPAALACDESHRGYVKVMQQRVTRAGKADFLQDSLCYCGFDSSFGGVYRWVCFNT